MLFRSTPFPFLDLPSELRNRIYEYTLFSKPAYRNAKGQRTSSRLAALLVSRKMHNEAAYILYSTTKFPLLFIQDFEAPPLVSELAPRYQLYVTNLKLILGPSWTDPPKDWKVVPRLARCLKRLSAVQTLRVFVQFDPSHPSFEKYRRSYSFYTDFCGDLLSDVLDAMPQLKYVELDGNSGVDVNGPLVRRLVQEAEEDKKEIRWGKQANWAHKYSPGHVSTNTHGLVEAFDGRTAEEANARIGEVVTAKPWLFAEQICG